MHARRHRCTPEATADRPRRYARGSGSWCAPPRSRGIEPFEQGHPLRENLVIIGGRGEQRAHRDIDAARLLARILPVTQICLVHDFRQPDEPPIPQACPLEQGLERAVLALMAQLDTGRIERDRVLWKLRGWREDELRVGIDESLDQPRRRDAIDVRSWARHPPAPFEFREIEGRPVLTAHRFRTSSTHGDDLLETPHLGSARGPEEVDVTNTLMILGTTRRLFLRALSR